MECISATESERHCIKDVLEKAKKRKDSRYFLDGFSFKSTKWFSSKLNETELGDLFLFWDGSAWGEYGDKRQRTLKDGVKEFIAIDKDSSRTKTDQFNDIKKMLKNKPAGEMPNSDSFPIIVGLDKSSPLLILDGNHRLSTLWWANLRENRIKMLIDVWLGYSPDLNDYRYYRCLL